jgi:hypothetical protein
MKYTVRPLSDRTWLRGDHQRTQSRFDTTWTKTLAQLGREVEHLAGRDLVLEVDVQERHIRQDGGLRADARAASPAVVVAFETPRHGSMLYRCDRYIRGWRSGGQDWQENVRAIALTLESLRAVDRYGATETGQQYAGFKAIGGGTAMPSGSTAMTRDQARDYLLSLMADPESARNQLPLEQLIKRARVKAHPDRHGGDHDLAYRVDEAAKVLEAGR